MQPIRILLSFAVLSCSLLPAQQTLIVDATGGGQYLEVEPAISAASPGDVILVRPGQYRGFLVDRGVTVISLGATVFSQIQGPVIAVRNVAAGQRVVVKGFTSSSLTMNFGATNTQAQVLFEDMHGQGGATASPNVSFRRCSFGSGLTGPSLNVVDSGVWLSQCALGAALPLSIVRSRVVFAESTAAAAPIAFGNPAVRMDGGTLTIVGGSDTVLTASTGGGTMPAIDVVTTGDVVLSPHATLVPFGGAPAVRGGRLISRTVPSLRATVLGAALPTRLHAPGSSVTVTMLGLPLQTPIATPFGDLWLPLNAVLLDTGAVDATGVRNLVVPLLPVAPGATFVVQSAALTGVDLALSTPLLFTMP